MRLILIVAVLLTACAPTSRGATDNPLHAELVMLTGSSARQCGLVPLGKDPAAAWKCAQSADRKNAPYWFALQRRAIDSEAWSAAVLTPSGQRYILAYDSNYMGGPGLLPRFTREACDGQIVLELQTPKGLNCSRK